MNKSIHYTRQASLIISMMLLLLSRVVAQTDSSEKVLSNYDPIAATLDSLVNQNFIQRLNFATAASQTGGSFQPREIPVYKDEVYAKRISKIQSPIALAYNQQVKEYIDLYAVRKRGLTERVMGLSNLYFPLYEEILDKNDLPLEFKYLSIVESALNPLAVSRMGATGLWQFMYQTGKMYNLKVNSFIDDRKDPIKATEAACQYFKDMYSIYHDWLLVIAAYNCGAGNVNRAIVRSGGKMNFWDISKYLPKETRGYVPAFIAVTYLMSYTTEHNLTAIPPVISFFEADTVLVEQRVSLRDIAAAIDVPYDLMAYLNPIYKKGIIPDGEESYVLRLPVNKINIYLANVDKIFNQENQSSFAEEDGSLVDPLDYIAKTIKVYHTVRRGDKLSSIANKYNCSVSDLKRWNKIKGNSVYRGKKLAIYTTVRQRVDSYAEVKKKDPLSVSIKNVDSPTTNVVATDSIKNDTLVSKNQENQKSVKVSKIVWHVVQPGDTLWSIARRYDGVTVSDLKSINKLRTNALKPGTKLKVKVSG
jgi:membrane-bound lytic murein transglycosylase D